ncbi:hypothetical protein QGN23_02910 [Chryseobacterium gotjawalense]|uniref:DUF4239 domain-containing protein n=1 Tax=Chryseobacterium gotjawalense TaxID=3042315 RepID=A0ABY8RE36_9FLAO|nr:hypothetical protein [Chryseobacterium sp. wdc7]WHF52235.1 hypothetical protein QGN23_02910 [Chryseobacterium sp. wdc7]
MDIIQSIKNADSNLIVFLLTSLIAFISWIIKASIEKPITESKATFENTYNTRIEILTEIKNRLTLILYFNSGDDNLKFKEQIQGLLLKDGKSAYLSKEILDNTIRISIDETNNKDLISDTISKIDIELYKLISKIEDEINFYRKFSNYNPLRKLLGIVFLALQNIITILLIALIIFILINFYIQSETCGKIFIIGISILLLWTSNWYLSTK